MSKTVQSEIHTREISRLIEAGDIRLSRGANDWIVSAISKQGSSRLGVLSNTAVETLRSKGHLVERRDGTLEPLRMRERSSGRLAGQRPCRPDDAAAIAPVLNAAESPLSWLHARKDRSGRRLISDAQFLSGERLRSDFERSMLAQRITASWDPTASAGRTGGNSAAEMSDGALAARQRYHDAVSAVGPELSSIMVQVCCLAAGIEQAERLLELPQRSGKAVLGLALTALARHYGLSGDAPPPSGGNQSTRWAMPDYRPAIPELEDA